MRHTSFLLTIIFISFFANAESKKETVCFAVEGMTCASCTLTLKAAVNKLDGIAKVEASVEGKNATVVFDTSKTNKEAIGKKINSVGYVSKPKQCS